MNVYADTVIILDSGLVPLLAPQRVPQRIVERTRGLDSKNYFCARTRRNSNPVFLTPAPRADSRFAHESRFENHHVHHHAHHHTRYHACRIHIVTRVARASHTHHHTRYHACRTRTTCTATRYNAMQHALHACRTRPTRVNARYNAMQHALSRVSHA